MTLSASALICHGKLYIAQCHVDFCALSCRVPSLFSLESSTFHQTLFFLLQLRKQWILLCFFRSCFVADPTKGFCSNIYSNYCLSSACAEKYHKSIFNEKCEFEKHCYILLLTFDPGCISQLLSEGFVVWLLLSGMIYFGFGLVTCRLLGWFNAAKALSGGMEPFPGQLFAELQELCLHSAV